MILFGKKNKLIWVLICGFLLAGCAVAPTVKTPAEENNLQDLCRRYDIDWQWDSVTQVVSLTKGGLKARVLPGSNVAVMGEEKITLSAPLKREKNIIIVPPDFKGKVIDRLTSFSVRPLRKIKEIVIDPGHGGKDPGAIGRSGLEEKTVVLDIAKRLKENLEAEGIKVTMVREKDEFIPLEERAAIARRTKADLFVSIHANASRAKSANGLEIYYLRDLDGVTKHELYSAINYQDTFRQFAMQQDLPSLKETLIDMMYVHKQADSKRLAEHLSRNTSGMIESNNRGSKSAGFFVLKNTLIPAVLIEIGFLSNREEEALLGTVQYRKEAADSLAKNILEYYSSP